VSWRAKPKARCLRRSMFEGIVAGRPVLVVEQPDGSFALTVAGDRRPGVHASVADALRAAESSLALVEDSL
jgi:hypothetical protein